MLDQTTPFRFTVAVIDGAIEGPSTAATTECPCMRAMGPVLYILVFVGRREHRSKKKKTNGTQHSETNHSYIPALPHLLGVIDSKMSVGAIVRAVARIVE